MQTRDAEKLLNELDKGNIFLQLGDWIDVMKYGASNNYVFKFGGPVNNTIERVEACPVISERDFGRLALFLVMAAVRSGTLGDIRLSLLEVLAKVEGEVQKERRTAEKQRKLNEVIGNEVVLNVSTDEI
jgi:hypothetical protein